MSATGGPDIVEDGLVLALDAANIKSYASSTLDVEYLIVAGGGNRIGRWRDNDQRSFVGNIYSIRSYNRELTAQEVLQNYNATKGRYGL